ncbi:DUF2931 family protein [Shewanella oneidensis]|uniref:Lipoprotein n=1 Tax=Shewanella oneidensis (strain ATCC 700550 / JCM 31522 / CIP 106686 / LMG 19005 / NCIMB 14063 / MR-1) TaxID=211586 RepID=Q8E858_SHEON|nr:DUF2931 family protein [Shewanella oneidensis]AAN53005.1 periplasmic protein of unknown function DUF2931 [Shewanella oneidensis MR-1]MDX5999750.1 DUF2931 family protein [Shewanella oneidensis]MEE2030356.1 hypothetical protein [Shewanella oneidensis]
MRWIQLLLLLPLITACQTVPTELKNLEWRHMVGSNADKIWVTEVLFYRQGKLVDASTNGASSRVDAESLSERDYRWLITAGRRDVHPAPDRVEVEWISFHDKKRYRISLVLPAELESMIAQPYRIKVRDEWLEVRRDNIGLGMTTGGYVEAFLTNAKVKPDILLARGIAKEVTDDPDEKRFPLSSQFANRWADFDANYSKAYQHYPVPSGMAWAPIMDAYRAAQPKTDTNPVQQ